MKTSTVHVGTKAKWALRGAALVAMACWGLVAPAGCAEGGGGGEGDRCDPALSHNECNGDLTCQIPADPITGATCGESYCCPTPATLSGNDYCNGKNEAPLPDGTPRCPLPASGGSSSSSPADASTE
jgi:hypothetical protein